MAAFTLAAVFITACEHNVDPEPDPEVESKIDFGDPKEDEYNAFHIADIIISTDKGKEIVSKDEYIGCSIKIDGKGAFADYEGTAKIRGRGNSTWLWYPKKPYKLKLDSGSPLLGMAKNKTWVLLANYRDVTHLMNNIGFTLAHCLDIPYANHTRYVRLTLNGVEKGLYVLTEQVKEGDNSVKLDATEGILLALDVNDGPDDCPYATDNFWSQVYRSACCIKYPEDATAAEVAWVKPAFAELEKAIQSKDWDRTSGILDVESMINYILAQEIMGNVEMNNGNSIRSGYINRYDSGSKWIMGPVWDCDGGFSYDWSDMYDSRGLGHTYFKNYKYLVFGTDPYLQEGAYGPFPQFFSDLFAIPEFVEAFKERWEDVHEGLLDYLLASIDSTEELIASSAEKDLSLWKIRYTHSNEVNKLKAWLVNRFDYLETVIPNYPQRD